MDKEQIEFNKMILEIQRERDKLAWNTRVRNAERKGYKKGYEIGFKQGYEEIRKEGSLAKTQQLITSLYSESADWLENCSIEQINMACDLALKNTDYEELKKIVLNDTE